MFNLIARLAIKHLKNEKLYTTINILGITLGLLAAVLILLYVREEQSVDQFHSKSDRIYRLYSINSKRESAIVPYKCGEDLQNEWSNVERLASIQNITIALTVKQEGQVYAQHGFVGADSTFFEIFDFPVLRGSRKEFLKSPDKMVITPRMAAKYFQDEDPIGQQLEVNLWGHYVQFEVQGIVECPENSHLQFEFLIPMAPVKKHFFDPEAFGSWKIHFAYTYILLKNSLSVKNDPTQVRAYLITFLESHGGKELTQRYTLDLEPLEDIYLKSRLQYDFPPRGDISHIRILTLVALGILLMAIINFINLSSAQSLRRLKNFSIKTILGSKKQHLAAQLILESLLIAFLSLLLVCWIISILIPQFNVLTGKSFTTSSFFSLDNLSMMIGLTLFVGIVIGIYQLVLVTSFKPIDIFESNQKNLFFHQKGRIILVVTQFTLAVLLILATGVVYEQVTFMQQKNLGFEKDQVLVMPDTRLVASNPQKTQLLKEELLKLKSVHFVSASSSYPGQQSWASRYLPDGFDATESISLSTIYADFDFVNTYGLEIVKGRDFNPEIASDSVAFLINEAATRLFSQQDNSWINQPLDQKIMELSEQSKGNVIGVIKDFHFESVRQAIVPLVICLAPENFFSIQIKIQTSQMANTVRQIESAWKELFPELPFTYTFVDQEFAQLYEADQKLGKILFVFLFISLAVAVLGLFGLSSFLAIEKSKEMSIRKVLGASENQLFVLLIGLFLKLILLANFITLPIGYFLMNKWLENFSFRISLSPKLFLISSGVTLLIGGLTVGFHALQTSRVNPVEILAKE